MGARASIQSRALSVNTTRNCPSDIKYPRVTYTSIGNQITFGNQLAVTHQVTVTPCDASDARMVVASREESCENA